jgi:two-component system OmpR family sensor kinase/two-component system sensor histidine kinase BaeS
MPKLKNRLFWQLLAAFFLIIILAGGGALLANSTDLVGRIIFKSDISSDMAQVWSYLLADYYAQHNSWDGVVILNLSNDRAPWNDEYKLMDYTLASAEGVIVAASDNTKYGQSLSSAERSLATPIIVADQQVGFLLLSTVTNFWDDHPLLLAGLAIGGFVIVIGLARRISHPLVNLTAATKSVAAGDLNVRVPVRSRGEIRELAIAFNTMTEKLAQADELRRNLTADVAHELRTPLTILQGKLEGVLDGVYPDSSEHLGPILDEIKLLTRLVDDLHLLSLAEAGQLPLEKRTIDIVPLLRDAQVNFTPQAADRGVTLAFDFPGEQPGEFVVNVLADERRITQVLSNLLTNALRYTPSGGQVTMTVVTDGEMARVTVTDTGAGIPLDDLPHIFERFWRGEKSRSRASGGAGLGLAIAKHLVLTHGGEIGVISPAIAEQSGTEARGSTFHFSLPLSPQR